MAAQTEASITVDAGGYYHTSSTIPAGSSCSATGDSVAGQMKNYA